MYLKEIEVSGFKSFADKLNIKLDNNITCIVGPNGSGKSNVVDAVRWVLGEQSVKSLRGDGGMSDVIFSGSKSRGASNVASVSLIFDNSDHYLPIKFDEVCIKRRIYRTGENEYFLNGEKCRLKDITDLFVDSGIGKTSFNIISQGEVMRILSTSPYDRRIIFEEAASVVKYKKRKDEALRKLDRTSQNMERVEDIITELENQVGPLKEQSKKAREYLDAKEKLQQVEVGLLAYEITELNIDATKGQKRYEEIEKELLSKSSTTSTSGAEIDTKKLELLKLESIYKQENERLLTLTGEVEKLNGEKKMLQERSKYSSTDARVHDNILLLKEKKSTLETELFDMEKQLENDKFIESNKTEELRKIEENLTSSSKRREDNLREYNTKSREYLEIKNKISILESDIENGGGLPASVKSVLNNPRLLGLHDTLSNLINTDEKFVKALEIALASSKNSIVVENENSAKNAINYLKEQRLGRATFFPINVIKPRFVDLETLNILKIEEGFIDTFENLVKYDNKYDSIIRNQLGNIIVAIDIDSANRIARKINNRYRIVTLDGDIINVGGSITGGSIQTNKSAISKKQELEILKKKKTELKSAILEINNSLEEFDKTRKTSEEEFLLKTRELAEAKEVFRTHVQNITSIKTNLEEVTKELNSLENVVDGVLSKEEEKLINSFKEKLNEKNEVVRTLEKLELQKEKLSLIIEELEGKQKLEVSGIRKLEQESKDLEIFLNKVNMKLDHHLEVLNEEYSMTYERAKKEYQLDVELEEAREKVSIYKTVLKKIGMVNLDSIEEYEKVNERYEFLTKQKEDLIHAKESLYEIISEMDEVMKEEFVKTFEEVRIEFKEVFKKLFGGGQADLKLTDPDNVLETGVEIIASPPGKKLTTITLLSGGEKTLTAISLLFAILNVRTVPFCLFDEVEAALDEANVDNFGKYLDSYKDKTQFLLITHKKRTMEYAKNLYGITMQESGVSKLVSVQLENIEKEEIL